MKAVTGTVTEPTAKEDQEKTYHRTAKFLIVVTAINMTLVAHTQSHQPNKEASTHGLQLNQVAVPQNY